MSVFVLKALFINIILEIKNQYIAEISTRDSAFFFIRKTLRHDSFLWISSDKMFYSNQQDIFPTLRSSENINNIFVQNYRVYCKYSEH